MKWDKLVDNFDAAHEVLVRLHFLFVYEFGCLLEIFDSHNTSDM
jgi:hypothetical protein